MRVIVAGSRGITDYEIIKKAIVDSKFEVTEIVSGAARGVDQLGERYANDHNLPIKRFFPDWNRYGKPAGYKRNVEMAEHADALIAIWDGQSKGTKHMLDIAATKGLKVFRLVLSDK